MYAQSVDEIMQKAVDVEKAGADFYRKLAAEVSNDAIKEVFLGFFRDEVKHQEHFIALAKLMNGVVIRSPINLLEIMSLATTELRHSMKGSEFVDMSEVNFAQAIKIAMHNEEEAVKVYASLLSIVHPGFNLIIKKIIEEERSHLAALENMKKFRLG